MRNIKKKKILVICKLNDQVADHFLMPMLLCNAVESIDLVRHKKLSYTHPKLVSYIYPRNRNIVRSYLNLFKKTKGILKNNSYDAIVIFNPIPYLLIISVADWFSTPTVTSFIGEDYNWYVKRKYFGYLFRKLLKKCKAITVFGEYAKNDLIEYKISVPIWLLPHSIDVSKYLPNLSQSNKITDVLFIGYLTKRKRVIVLINAIKRLIHQYPEIQTSIVGKGPESARLERAVNKLGLSHNIKFYGFVEDSSEHRANAKVFVTLGSMEGVPFSIVEAICTGLPIVASNVGATSSIVKNNVNGILLSTVTPKTVSESIQFMIQNEKRRMAYANNSSNMSKSFSYENAVSVWSAILST